LKGRNEESLPGMVACVWNQQNFVLAPSFSGFGPQRPDRDSAPSWLQEDHRATSRHIILVEIVSNLSVSGRRRCALQRQTTRKPRGWGALMGL